MAPILPLKTHHAPDRIDVRRAPVARHNNCPDGIELEHMWGLPRDPGSSLGVAATGMRATCCGMTLDA
jgi:hypothetical protein